MRIARPPADTIATGFAILSATLIIAHQVAGKATRDGLFLAHFDVTRLPRVVMVTAIASILGVLAMSRLLARHGPARVVPAAFATSGLLFAGEWLLFGAAPHFAAVVLYLHMGVFGALLISGFWSVVNERFDPYTAKRTVARIAAAATLGGLLGGVIAEGVADTDVRAMLLVLAGLHLVCAAAVRGVSVGGRAGGGRPGLEVRDGLRVLAGSRYLSAIALLMVVVALTAALLDYALKSEAAARFDRGRELVGFFAGFYAAVGVAAFAVQSLLGGRALRRLGLAGTMAVLPLAVIGGGAVALAVPRLATVAGLRAAEVVFANSFFRAGFELLFTPVAPADKRPTKSIIDVASNRLGDLLGAGLLLGLLALLPVLPTRLVLACAVACAALGLVVVWRLHRGYVSQLAGSLRSGAVSVDTLAVADATTRRILAEWSPAAERAMLLDRVRRQRAGDGRDPSPLSPAAGAPARLIAELTSGDVERARRALHARDLDHRCAPYVIDLLAHPELGDDARLELRWLVPRVVGLLSDALQDPDVPVAVRQRIPSVLEVYHNPRAVEALLQGLEDPEFQVRYTCARVLARMLGRSKDLDVDRERVLAAVLREIEVDELTWKSRGDFLPADFDAAVAAPEGYVEPSLQHVFTLLGLVVDQDAMRLAMYAVTSRDQRLRGTAIEYLENVLPESLRRGLWRHVGVRAGARRSARGASEILGELRRRAGRQASP